MVGRENGGRDGEQPAIKEFGLVGLRVFGPLIFL